MANELLTYVVFLVILFIISYANRDPVLLRNFVNYCWYYAAGLVPA